MYTTVINVMTVKIISLMKMNGSDGNQIQTYFPRNITASREISLHVSSTAPLPAFLLKSPGLTPLCLSRFRQPPQSVAMAKACERLLLPFLVLSILLLLRRSSSFPTVGITYSPPSNTSASHLPAAEKVREIIESLRFSYVRLPDSDPGLIRAFAYTNISLLLGIPDSMIQSLASNRSAAVSWIYRHVLPFYPRSKISLISVGNDVLNSIPTVAPYIIPAIRNLQLSLLDLGIKRVPVSTTFSFNSIVTTAFPPSTAKFQQPIGDIILKPVLQHLERTNSSFLVNMYPYNAYKINTEIPIGFALFQENPFNFRDDTMG